MPSTFTRSRSGVLRFIATLAVVWLPSGCIAALGAGSIITTDKTPIDHAWSLSTGKDCSTVRKQQGLTYCVEDEVIPPVNVHCYPTLGEVSCYEAPDPYPGKQRTVGSRQALAAPPATPPVPFMGASPPGR